MMRGGVKRSCAQRVQSKICTSVPQIEAILTLTRTSLDPIFGTDTSLYSIPLACFIFTTAFTYRIPYHKTIRWHFSLSTSQPGIVKERTNELTPKLGLVVCRRDRFETCLYIALSASVFSDGQ